ncbi:MAG: hypothetical protein HOO96_27860 [Polyangiaceae bacterium]|nr:hypothetical protein [Polyangiaceae bacterium]
MKTHTLLWMAGVSIGTVLIGGDTVAAPQPGGPTLPASQCVRPPALAVNATTWPSPAQCGNPAFRAACPSLENECTIVNKAEAQKVSSLSGVHGGKTYVDNKLYGTPSAPGFAESSKERNYGIVPAPPAGPFATNGNLKNLDALRAKNGNVRRVNRVGQAPNNNLRWAYQESKARAEALAWTPGGRLAVYQRPHAAPGPREVGSCEDYVYKGFSDDERWLDAIYGCKGDVRCEANVSLLPVAPGIAGRALDNPLMPSFTQFVPDYDGRLEFRGMMPRNAFYAGTGAFIPASLIDAFASAPAKKQSLQALADALRNGFSTYDIGHGQKGNSLGSRSQGFADEWDFHTVMNGRTAAVTEGERDEYQRRNDAVLAAMDNFWTVAKCVAHLNPQDCEGIPSAVGHVKPGEAQMFDGDPFVSRAVFGNVDRNIATDMLSFVNGKAGMLDALRSGAHIGSGLAFPGLADRGSVALGTPLLQTALAAPQKTMLTGGPITTLNGMVTRQGARIQGPQSPGVGNGQLAYLDLNWRARPPTIDTSAPYPRLLCPTIATGKPTTPATSWANANTPPRGERFVGELAACQAVNVILDEWGKKTAGNRGPTCFDTGNAACDWSPEMFVKRWVVNTTSYNMPAKERAYASCRAWRSTLFAGGARQSDPRTTLNVISEKEVARGTILRGLPVKETNVFGQDKQDQHTGGNKAFGVGYSYDLGWEARIRERFSAVKLKQACAAKGIKEKDCDVSLDQTPCRMGGRMHASFDAFAWAFGLPPIDIVEASYALDASDDKTHAETNKLEAYGHGDFLSGAYEFFKIPDGTSWPLNATGSAPRRLAGVHDGGEETLLTVPVQISWVTLTFTVGMAWGYGADVFVFANAPAKDQCSKNLFEVGGGVEPYAHLDLVVGADCSIAGIAGVGVDVDIVLLDIRLPIHGGAALSSSPDNKLFIGFDAGLDLKLGTLDGHMSAYAKFIGIKLFEVELFHWKGLHTTIPLFHFQPKRFELLALGAADIPAGDGAMTCRKPGSPPDVTGPPCPTEPSR